MKKANLNYPWKPFWCSRLKGKKHLSISLDHTRSLTIEKGKCIWFSWSNAFLKQILSIWFWGNLAQAELSGDSRMFITCSFGGQHLCHSSLWHHSFYCKWLQCKSVRRSKHKPMKMRHAGMMLQGHFYCLCQVCLFLMADRCLFSVQELSFNIRVFFRQSKVLLDAYLKKTGSYPRLVCKISVKLYVTHDLEAIFYIVTKYSTPHIIID